MVKSLKVRSSALKGEMKVPSSKSHTLRAILFASMAKGESEVIDYLDSPDSQRMIEACRHLGAEIQVLKNKLVVKGIDGRVDRVEDVIQSGNSGIVFRFMAAIGALSKSSVVVTGDPSIRYQRPIEPLLSALNQLSCEAKSANHDGTAPIIVKGPLKPGRVVMEGHDSQPVSAMLIAASFVEGETEIHVKNPGEIPWLKMTVHWLQKLAIPVKQTNFSQFTVTGKTSYPGFQYAVPGDLSSAAFPLAAAVLTKSRLVIENIDMNDPQGDKEIVFALKRMGADIEIDEIGNKLIVKPSEELKGIELDMAEMIDAVPIMAVVGCFAKGKTVLKNCGIARKKESDRLRCMSEELQKMGARIEEYPDSLIIYPSPLKGALVNSHHDHRVAMALLVAALTAEGETEIIDPKCVEKTYPGFAEAFKKLGVDVEEVH